MTDEAKLHSPIHSTFEALVVWLCSQALSWRKTGPFLLTSAGCRHCSFRCISLIFWPYFPDVTVSPGFRKLCGSEGQQTTKQWPWPFYGASLALRSALEFLLRPATELVIAGRHKIHFSLHITIRLRNGSLLLCRIRENDTSKWWFLWLAVSSWSTHLSSFFTFPVCFKCWATIEWSTLSSSATSYVVVISASMILSPGYYQLLMVTHCTPPFTKALISLAKCLEPLVSSSWANCIVDVVSYLHCLMSHF